MDSNKVITMNLIKKFSIGLAVATMSLAANASFITVTADGGFTSATTNGGAAIAPVDTASTSQVSWGTPINGGGQSSLLLTDQPTVSIDLLDTNYLLSTLTHINKSIDGINDDFLDKAVIGGTLAFVGTDFLPGINTLFDIDFKETGNLANIDYCVNEGNNGETGPTDPNDHAHATACDDRFDYTVDGATFPVAIPLSIGGVGYTLTLFGATDLAGNNLIPDNRFWTPENGDTNVYTFARLARVPEPASIAILGLGLLGLASSRKRKTK